MSRKKPEPIWIIRTSGNSSQPAEVKSHSSSQYAASHGGCCLLSSKLCIYVTLEKALGLHLQSFTSVHYKQVYFHFFFLFSSRELSISQTRVFNLKWGHKTFLVGLPAPGHFVFVPDNLQGWVHGRIFVVVAGWKSIIWFKFIFVSQQICLPPLLASIIVLSGPVGNICKALCWQQQKKICSTDKCGITVGARGGQMRQNWFVTLRNRVRDLQGCPPSGTHCAVQAHVFQPKLHFVSGNKGTGRRRCSTSPPAVRQGTAWKNQKKPCAVCWGLGAALAASQPFSLHHLGPRNVPYRRHCQGCFFLCFQAPFYCHWGLKQR